MFRGLINDAKSAAASVLIKYLARASVAVPFVIAIGFAIAASAHMLIERFGAVTGCWLLAAGFTLIGLLATLLVKRKEQQLGVAERQAEKTDTANVASDAAAEALLQAPLALAGALFSTPLGPKGLIGVAKALARNLPLIVLLGLIALLFWPSEQESAAEHAVEEPSPPLPEADGAYRPRGNGIGREQAA